MQVLLHFLCFVITFKPQWSTSQTQYINEKATKDLGVLKNVTIKMTSRIQDFRGLYDCVMNFWCMRLRLRLLQEYITYIFRCSTLLFLALWTQWWILCMAMQKSLCKDFGGNKLWDELISIDFSVVLWLCLRHTLQNKLFSCAKHGPFFSLHWWNKSCIKNNNSYL